MGLRSALPLLCPRQSVVEMIPDPESFAKNLRRRRRLGGDLLGRVIVIFSYEAREKMKKVLALARLQRAELLPKSNHNFTSELTEEGCLVCLMFEALKCRKTPKKKQNPLVKSLVLVVHSLWNSPLGQRGTTQKMDFRWTQSSCTGEKS